MVGCSFSLMQGTLYQSLVTNQVPEERPQAKSSHMVAMGFIYDRRYMMEDNDRNYLGFGKTNKTQKAFSGRLWWTNAGCGLLFHPFPRHSPSFFFRATATPPPHYVPCRYFEALSRSAPQYSQRIMVQTCLKVLLRDSGLMRSIHLDPHQIYLS
jgi:hypothetical protein